MTRKKRHLIIYLITSVLLLANLTADAKFQTSMAGYWGDRALFWLWLFLTIFNLIVFWKNRITKIYLGLLFTGLILSILPMMIPFFAMILSATGKGLLFKTQITPQYRVQIINYSIMSRPHIEIIENKGLLEHRIARTNAEILSTNNNYLEVNELTGARLITETDNTIIIEFLGDKLRVQMVILKAQ
ncbi:hypothetical protein PBAL39_00802 [Pedobacter sp. BAL39]|uniref:hypothetical protein n=1 Tax=Pedobacter sp. BAL39 TaxID=391596 RepID=UPI0001559EA1|nr:hypothetical protein [Pedobacter sp. BAL39]EDM38109.1 hypothetical protein PBAL39_00802 [Pedobacter sp. BAL39]